MLGDELFTVNFEPVWRILEALEAESVLVPRTRLLTLIEAANKEPLEYPMDNVLGEALPLLGRHCNPDDLAMLERFLEFKNDDVSRGASKGLYHYYRFADRIRDPEEVLEQNGWDALTTAEKHVCAIERLDAEVRNGGFAQYYFNSSGDHWQDTLRGLAAIGANTRHHLMSSTVKKFGKVEPSNDDDTRTIQLSKLVRKQEDPFNAEDTAWYKLQDENLDVLILKYNLSHLEGRYKAEQNAAP